MKNLDRMPSCDREMGLSFSEYLLSQQQRMNEALKGWFAGSKERVVEAACYSLFLPSKRIRPLFCLETCRAFSGAEEAAFPGALAVEMVHTYSLIHDDLPSMDNDDLRRGQPTNHRVYGEATAILAGDGLLTSAFEVLARDGQLTDEARIRSVRELSEASGMFGMVLGQHMDMAALRESSLESLEHLHRNKTGKLLAASCVLGGIAAGVNDKKIEQIRDFALDMGLAFQIRDDLLDVEGGSEIGKPIRSDERNEKKTYVSLLGLEGARQAGQKWYDQAIQKLKALEIPFENRLEQLTRFVIDRKL